MLLLTQTMGMRTSRRTYLALITGCARASRSAAAYDLYRSRQWGCVVAWTVRLIQRSLCAVLVLDSQRL